MMVRPQSPPLRIHKYECEYWIESCICQEILTKYFANDLKVFKWLDAASNTGRAGLDRNDRMRSDGFRSRHARTLPAGLG